MAQPNPRHLEEITYDSKRNKLLLFGGAEVNNEVWKEPSLIFEWDGKTWEKIDVQGPPGRRGHGWVYDENKKEAILIGGVAEGKILKDSVVFDVWSWDGNKWKPNNTNCPVKEPEAVYDPANKRILVYGDANNKSRLNYNEPTAFELWEYKNGTWNRLSTDGPDIRGSRMIAFDNDRKRLVIPVFEQNKMIVWEWKDNVWEKIVCENEYPVYRTRFALAYYPAEKQTLLFGGLSEKREQLGDFWKWNGKKWEKIETTIAPSVRNSTHFASNNNQLFLYGGSVPKALPEKGIELSNELWSWEKGFWKKLK
jgi:hypothetical protein